MDTLHEEFSAFTAAFLAKRQAAQARYDACRAEQAEQIARAACRMPAPTTEQRTEFYRRALARHDWFFQYSDDYSAFKAGEENEWFIRTEQRAIDAAGVLWNVYAPREFVITVREVA
jgi:hypothetical protein